MTRRGYAVGGGFVAVIGVFLLVVGFIVGFTTTLVWLLAATGVVLIAYGIVVVVRGRSLSVTLTHDTAVVRGIVTTTTVPRTSIQKATNKPSLEWTDAAGRQRSTRLTALTLGNRTATAPAVVQHVDEEYLRLKAWISGTPGRR